VFFLHWYGYEAKRNGRNGWRYPVRAPAEVTPVEATPASDI
jgi:hypothetical protein